MLRPWFTRLLEVIVTAIPLAALQCIVAQDAVVGVRLGPPAGHPPVTDSDWNAGVVIDRFLPANAENRQTTATSASLVWDDTALYVSFRCADPDPVYRDGVRVRRSDRVVVGIVPEGGSQQDLLEFQVDQNGVASVHRADQQVDWGGASARIDDGQWTAEFRIPWSEIGPKPQTRFLLQLSRVRGLTGEVLSPSAVDYHDGPMTTQRLKAATDEFMEVHTEGAKGIVQAGSGLITLPSGIRRWERTAAMKRATIEERREIARLQDELERRKTTASNLAQRVRLAEVWYDLLAQEGFSFHYDSGTWILEPGELDPWTARHEFNDRLARNDVAEACLVLDGLLQHFNRVSNSWFADGTPGDVQDSAWIPLRAINSISQSGDEVVLHGQTDRGELELSVAFPSMGGMRIHGPVKGFFSSSLSPIQMKSDADGATISARDLVARIVTGNAWQIALNDAKDSHPRWRLMQGDLRILQAADGKVTGIQVAGPLVPNEEIFGLGERFDSVNQRGKTVTLWELDAWESTALGGLSNQAYKPIPLWHSTLGYSVFWNTSYEIRADFGADLQDRYRMIAHGPVLDLWIWSGDYAHALRAYAALTGRPLLPPVWAFEPWMGGGGGRWAEEQWLSPVENMLDVVARFKNLDIPHSSIYAEGPGSFEPLLYRKLQPLDIRVLTWGRSQATDWSMEQIRSALPNLEESQLPLMRVAGGRIYQFPQSNLLHFQFPYIDFTNSTALDLVRAYWKHRLDLGVAGTMVDFADLVPRDAVFHDGTSGEEMHNAYVRAYDHAIHQVFKERRGDDFILFARGAAPGTQVDAGQMAGDHGSDFRGLDESLNGGLSLSVSGLSSWGFDVGGYWRKPDEEVYLRWIEFGAFSPLMRFHGTEPREPWFYSDTAITVYKKYAWLRENLLPYIYGTAQDAHASGIAMMRPIISADHDEYMLGDDLLVAPVHGPGEHRRISLPQGDWTDFWTGESVESGVRDVAVPLEYIPVFLRAGSLIPVELAPSFRFGDSMSGGRVAVLIATPPGAEGNTHTWTLPDGHQAFSVLSKNETPGFQVSIDNWGQLQFLMIVGLRHQVKGVTVNAQALPVLNGETAERLPPGWVLLGPSRVLVRLPKALKYDVRFEIEN